MTDEYYAVVAQALPVLFLAAAVEFRLLQPSEEEAREEMQDQPVAWLVGNVMIMGGFVLTVAIGEIAALRAVAGLDALPHTDTLISAALAVSGVLLLLVPVMNMLQLFARTREAQGNAAGWARSWASGLAFFIWLGVLAQPVYTLLVVVL